MKILEYGSKLFPSLAAKKAAQIFLTPEKFQRPESEKDWYASAKKYLINDKFAAFEWGHPQGAVVLLVHGWAGRGTQMAAFAAPLVASGHRVIALDGPAHGESIGSETNAGEFARFLLEVQQSLGSVKAVIAHSFGAGCSILAAHLGMKVSQFVLISSPSDYAKVVSGFLDFVKISPRAQKRFYDILISKAQISPQDLSIAKLGANFNLPVLVVHDKADKEVSFDSALDLNQAWPHSQLLATQGLGHRRILKDPEVIDKVAQFILSK